MFRVNSTGDDKTKHVHVNAAILAAAFDDSDHDEDVFQSKIQIVADIVNNVLHERHEAGWNATQPPGTEGDSLLQVLETFAHVAAQSLENHVTDGHIGGRIGFEEAYLSTTRAKIG